MNVEQFGNIATSPNAVLLSEGGPDVGALLVDDGALLSSGASCPDLSDEVPESRGRRHPHC